MRFHSIIAVFFLFSANLLCANLSPTEIEQAAEAIISAHYSAGLFDERALDGIVPIEGESYRPIGWVAVLKPTGFLALSAREEIEPLIAFSYDNDFPSIDSPENALLNILRSDLKSREMAIPNTAPGVLEKNRRLWSELLNGLSLSSFEPSETFGPMMDTRWEQGPPYNDLCPIDPETGDRSVVGCTATSMAQVINFWEFPPSVSFDATESYWSDSTVPPIWIDAATATIETIDYNGAGVHPTAAMKAAISWACGVSIWAIYGSEGTIAWFHDTSFTEKWGYLTAEKVDPPEMTDFYERLHSNMLSAMPAQLGIFQFEPDTSGHAIVCDGFMDGGYYHLNYGWGGFYDAWYRLPDDLPAPLTIVRWAIIDIRPPYRPDAGEDTASAIVLNINETEATRGDEIHPAEDEDWFRFIATADSTYVFYTNGPTDTRGELFVEGAMVLSDDNSHDSRNFQITFLPDSSGECFLRITAGRVGIYSLYYSCIDAPFMRWTYPVGGENLAGGSSAILRWTRGGTPSVPKVSLAYSLEGEAGPWSVIADSINNSGILMWAVPEVETSRHDCYLKVYETLTGRFVSMSERFSILEPGAIKEAEKPSAISLSAHPNPFNSAVRITIDAPVGAHSRAPLQIEIFDVNGRMVDVITRSDHSVIARSASDEAISPFTGTDCRGLRPRNDGEGQFVWQPDETVASGVYLVRARFDTRSLSGGYRAEPRQAEATGGGAAAAKRIVYLK